MLAIVDYGRGISGACRMGSRRSAPRCRSAATQTSSESADAVVFPGVGAFRDCMQNLTGEWPGSGAA